MSEGPQVSLLVIYARALTRSASAWIFPALLVLLALALRFEHLAYPHYYLLGPDSNFFHWFALRIMDGQGAPPDSPPLGGLHSGLAYPLAYMGKAISFAFHISHAQALTIVCKLFPPFLGVISLVVVYLASVRLSNRRVGLFAAFTWACILPAVSFGAAGFIDRDGLVTLLLTLGVVVFYLSKDWCFRLGSKDVGWLSSGLIVLAIMAMLYLTWGVVGSVILFALIAGCFVVKLVVELISSIRTQQGTKLRIASALGATNWRVFALLIVCSALLSIKYHSELSGWVTSLWRIVVHRGVSEVAELQGIGGASLLVFYLFLIPLTIGLVISFYSVWKSRSSVALFLCTWLLLLLVSSVFSWRMLLFAAAPASIVSGLGLTFVWGWAKLDRPRLRNRIAAVAIVLLLVLTSMGIATSLGNNPSAAIDDEWQDALAYLRDPDNTPADSVIMTQWGRGYWILDVAQRKPFEDNGYYGYDATRSHDVGVAYATSDPSVAAQIMRSDGVDYLVFCKSDSKSAPAILGWAGLEKQKSFPEESLFSRSINGEFESGGGLQVVYRSAPNSEVVILKLIQSE